MNYAKGDPPLGVESAQGSIDNECLIRLLAHPEVPIRPVPEIQIDPPPEFIAAYGARRDAPYIEPASTI